MKDEVLVRRFLERDELALAEARTRYGAYCLAVARNICPEPGDAEECLNDALLATWNSIPPQEPEDLKTYLGKLTRERAIDRWREARAKKRTPPDGLVSLDELEDMIGENAVEEAVEYAELSRAISAFLYTVREAERNVFIRRYWYGDSVESICARTGYKKSRVLMMLKRTRDRLADRLRKEGYHL